MSPAQRSLAALKQLGYRAKVVEKWNPFAKIRQDLFGGDILALPLRQRAFAFQLGHVCAEQANEVALQAVPFQRRRRLQPLGEGRGDAANVEDLGGFGRHGDA